MKLLKRLKWNVILSSILYVTVGVLLLVFPDIMAKNICYIIGFFAIAIGIVNIIDYCRKDLTSDTYSYNLVIGLMAVLLGIFIFVKVEMMMAIIPFLLGLAVVVSGLLKFQNAVDLIRLKYSGWKIVLLISVLNNAFGIVLMADPFKSAIILSICLGIGLIYSGVSDLITTIILSKTIRTVLKAANEETTEIVN